MNKTSSNTIVGFVIRAKTISSTLPYEYLLIGDDGENYYLDKKDYILDLDEFLETRMSVTGSVSKLKRGYKLLAIKGYESLESSVLFFEDDTDDLFDTEFDWLDRVV